MLAPFAGMACATPRASTQVPPLTAPTTERAVRLVSVHVGETDWVGTQAAMLRRFVELPFRLYATVRDGQIQHVSETWRRITGDTPALVAEYSTAMNAAKTWNGLARCFLSRFLCLAPALAPAVAPALDLALTTLTLNPMFQPSPYP